ncbi:MAG: two-component system response regulator NarL [Aeromonas sp.]
MDELKHTVLVVDDHPLMRKGIVQLLSLEDNLEVVAEASNGTDAVALAKQHEPDLILLDLNMKGLSGLDTLRALRAEELSSRVVILTVSNARQDVQALLKAGADGYLLKDSEPDVLLDQLADVLTGKQILSESLRPYLETLHEVDVMQKKLDSLTRRENQILREVAKGLSNKQVAASLHISEGTVKVHVKSLLKKLDAQSRVEATVMFLEYRQRNS